MKSFVNKVMNCLANTNTIQIVNKQYKYPGLLAIIGPLNQEGKVVLHSLLIKHLASSRQQCKVQCWNVVYSVEW